MDWLITVLDWLKNPDNRTVLTFIGGGIVVVAGAIWKVYEHYDAKKTQSLEPAQPSKSTADSNTVSLPSIPKRADIPPLDAAARRSTYLRLMAKEWRTLPVEALDSNAADTTARRLNLEQVYIDLDPVTPRSGRSPDRVAGDREGPLSAVEALCQANRQRLVLLGQPGSGKSPFGRHLGVTLAEALLQPVAVNLAERLPGWIGAAPLPVFVPRRHLVVGLTGATGAGTAGGCGSFSTTSQTPNTAWSVNPAASRPNTEPP
jgi:hypothetical protein